MNEIKVGTYTGDGAVQNISIGFVPAAVIIINVTDGDYIGLWFNGMTDDTSVDIAAAVVANAADGISGYAGSTTAGPGFTVGTDFSENAKVFRYIALRGGAGAQS